MSKVNEWQHLKIPFKDIEVATENFKTLIGRGGYGWVYKGKLLVSGKETTVAVKRLNEQFGQGLKEFLTEIQLLSGQHHPNLISLVGYCDEGKEKTIIYEYAERGSLDQYIRRSGKNSSTTLTWLQRLKICADAARGLDHLHSHVGGYRTIIHRDIKSSNILIDENWVGKISDLGLSKLSVSGFGMSVIVSNGCGTQGYCEPEYYTTGFVTKKSDVYSFGVVLFEVLCGRLCLIDCDDGFSLSSISAKENYKNNSLNMIIDPSLKEHIGSYSMTKFAEIAYRCLHNDREQRPAMDVVAKELEEALRFQVIITQLGTTNHVRAIGMIAGRHGITPLFQVARAILENPKDTTTQVHLIDANVAYDNILLKEEIDALATNYPDRFRVFYILNQPPEGWTGGVGFVSALHIKTHCPAPAPDIKILRCGPPPMMKAMASHLERLGYSSEMLFEL